MESASRIHRLSKCAKPFSQWINEQKADYNKMIKDQKISGKMPFNVFLNKKWEMMKNQNADGKKKLWGTLGSMFEKTSKHLDDIQKEKESKKVADSKPLKISKTILGLKPMAFYSIAGLATIGIVTATYFIIKKSK